MLITANPTRQANDSNFTARYLYDLYALCLIGKKNNKEPERNIWCKALKIVKIKKDL